jgi:hypothetical protein
VWSPALSFWMPRAKAGRAPESSEDARGNSAGLGFEDSDRMRQSFIRILGPTI